MRNAGVVAPRGSSAAAAVSSAVAAIWLPESGVPVAGTTPGRLDAEDEVPNNSPRLELDLLAGNLAVRVGGDAGSRFRLGWETAAPCPGACRGWEAAFLVLADDLPRSALFV